ncbi:MAG: tetratricopeptide repeat protein [Prevotella sp.]|jgi:tetratricopeptide (TPR) repeat protein
MRAIKYVLLGALLFGTAPAMAQNDNKAIIDNVTKIISSKGPNVADQVKDIYKANKKNPEVLVGIGQAYLNVKDTANATKYADLALKRNNKYAKAWILKGDIAVIKDDGGEAASMYQNAMYFDPKEPDGYYKYALVQRGVNPQAAVDALEQLRKNRPDFPVDAYSGRIFYNAGKFEDAVNSYSKVSNLTSMEDQDITNYAISNWLLGNRDKAIEICNTALAKNPRKAAWNRVAFYCHTDKKDADQALAFADKLFNQSDSAHFTGEDYTYYGTALKLAQKYDEALNAYSKALEMNKGNEKQTKLLYGNLSEVYMEKQDFDNAVKYLQMSFGSEPTFQEYFQLADIYTRVGDALVKANRNDEAKTTYEKAINLFKDMKAKFPNYKTTCNYLLADTYGKMDPDSKEGLAKPYYEEIINTLGSVTDLQQGEKQMLGASYFYMMVYQINVMKDLPSAKEYAQKLMTLEPENQYAKQVMDM